MSQLHFVVHTLDGSTSGLSVSSNGALFIGELLTNFAQVEDNVMVVRTCQPATSELKSRLATFVKKHSAQMPELNKLAALFRKIPDGQWFLIASDWPKENMEKFHIHSYLMAINHAPSEDIAAETHQGLISRFENEFAAFFASYEMSGFGDRKKTIGEPDKAKRKCRFCGQTRKSGASFQKKAHAIPESLGNKGVVLAEECDSCNEFFGNDIEPHLVEYLTVHRTFLGTKGSNGAPKKKFKDRALTFHNGNEMVVAAKMEGSPEEGFKVKLDSYVDFVPLKMFKALCKITLSTLDNATLAALTGTIDWLRYDKFPDAQVAKIASSIDHAGFSRHPQITNYVRRSNNSELPHVVSEFRLGSWVYVYLLPLSSADERNFSDEDDFQRYWQFFKRYSSSGAWSFIDCNSRTPRKLSMTLQMKPSAGEPER